VGIAGNCFIKSNVDFTAASSWLERLVRSIYGHHASIRSSLFVVSTVKILICPFAASMI
jgi:hypothetical protein